MALPAQAQRTDAPPAQAGWFARVSASPSATPLAVLALLALTSEGALIVFMRRLSLKRFPDVLVSNEPVADALGINTRGLTWFVLALAVLTLAYVIGYGVALRVREPRWGLAVLAASAVFITTMIPVFPGGAQDVYHNIADARTLWVYHQDPISTPPNAHPADPIVQQVVFWQDLTSSYGPVWYIVSGAPLPFAGSDLVKNVIGQKVLVSLFLLGTLGLVYLIVKERRPRSATAAMVLIGWSPLILWEIPGNAHNDVVMLFFAVAALYAIHRGAWQWAFPLLALGVGVKFIVALLGPILLVWLLWRRPRVDRRELIVSLLYGGAILGLIYLPFFAASHSLANTDALRNRYISSPASLTIAFLMQYTSLSQAMDLTRALALTLYGVLYLAVLWRARGGFEQLVQAAFWAILLTLAVPTWWFWPWYVVWLLPLAAIASSARLRAVALVLTTFVVITSVPYTQKFLGSEGINPMAGPVGRAANALVQQYTR